MIKNSAVVYINGINVTSSVVFPLKWGNFLDEQLDEMYISLRFCKISNFKPLSPVEIHFTNTLYFGKTTVNTQTKVKRYIVANDNNVTEKPVGSKFYDHDLYVIELTKIAECFVVDTITFTNDLGRSYTESAKTVTPNIQDIGAIYDDSTFPSQYKSPMGVGDVLTLISGKDFFSLQGESGGSRSAYHLEVLKNGIQIQYIGYEAGSTDTSAINQTLSLTLSAGTYTVTYYYWITTINGAPKSVSVTFDILVVQNQHPLKKWTITDCINRILDLAEPIRSDENPRFILQGAENGTPYKAGSQAELFDKVLAPQFAFTKSTLRECLQQCGKVIHGEPRIDIGTNADGSFYYLVKFDLYGQTEQSNIYSKKYIAKTVSQAIDSYATHLDSNAENLVNQLDKYGGVIVEPYAGGYKTVRTESLYVRITDENMMIPTQYPIYSIEKLECGVIPQNETAATPPIDITNWVFESTLYNSQLSSYSSEYPYSKAFGLMYTQGQKGITALNFKPENPISSVFENYAIVNILESATNKNINITTGYPLLAFRVTYTPFYNSRVSQTKVNYQDYPYGAALIYNQQANVIESRYYGENLKGAIARIGNVEKSITFILARFSEIPEAGQMYDADYYISAVSVEFMPTYIKCTIGLSKDFNRLSQYIGISSVKRFSEVSQTQSVERNLLYREYVVIGDQIETDVGLRIGATMLSAIGNTFTQQYTYSPLTNVLAWGKTYQGSDLPCVSLPVVSSAFGNSIAFSWEYEDNYSAGATSTYQVGGGGYSGVTGYFQNNYQYTDYYGRMYYYGFDLQQNGELPTVTYTPTDITSSVTYTIASDAKSATINIPNPNGYEVTVSYSAMQSVSSGSPIGMSGSFTTTGTSYTIVPQVGNATFTSVTINSATEQVPDYSFESQSSIGCALPQGTIPLSTTYSFFGTLGTSPYVLRKDNREKLQCNVQIDFVTNRDGLIIGSALASYCGVVRGSDSSLAARLYVFDQPINKFINHVEGALNIDLSTVPSVGELFVSPPNDYKQFYLTAGNFPASGKAWAIITQQTEGTPYQVEDEEGNVITVTDTKGGDVLLAQNMDITEGETFPTIYFTAKRKIFNTNCWVANR